MPLGQGAVPRTHNTLSRCRVVPIHGHIDPLCPANTACAEHFAHGGQIGQEQLGQTCWVLPPPPLTPPGHIFSVSRSLLLQMGISPAVLFVKLFQLNKLPTGCILVHFGALTSHESRRKHFSPTRPWKHQEHPKLNCKMRGHVGIYKCKEHNAR